MLHPWLSAKHMNVAEQMLGRRIILREARSDSYDGDGGGIGRRKVLGSVSDQFSGLSSQPRYTTWTGLGRGDP
jgi:hypothetical protein